MLRQARSPESSRMPISSCPRRRSSRPDLDRPPHAFQRVVGIDEEDAIVGHRLGVGPEGLHLVVEAHDPAMGVGALDGDAEQPAGQDVEVAAQPPI